MARIEKTVFISYRRADVYTALAVYENLKNQGYDVFFDYRSISSGDFEQIITSNIRARAHFLLILTPTALDRCNEPGDWLRREIETAIDEKRNIVPLFFKGFRFGVPSNSGKSKLLRFGRASASEALTGKLRDLSRYNGLNVHEDYFDEAMYRLRTEYLSKPLNTVLHPVSTEVQKVVRAEQVAADKALEQIEDVKEMVKQTEEKPDLPEAEPIPELQQKIPAPVRHGGTQGPSPNSNFNFRLLGGFAGGVTLLVILIWGGSKLFQNLPARPESTGALQTNETSVSQPSATITFEPEQTKTQSPSETAIPLTPTLGIGSAMISEKDGMTLLYVPAGEFIMGSDILDEKPAHTLYLDAFWIDRTEVTNSMYSECVANSACNNPKKGGSYNRDFYFRDPAFDNYPVIHVSWEDAKSYCEWADRRLPTEAEWEKAARGNDERDYPWGNNSPNNSLLNYGNEVGDTTEVGKYPDGASPYGALDMAGNVAEWVADWYGDTYYASSPSSNPFGPAAGQYRVQRGGTYSNYNISATSRLSYYLNPTDSVNAVGFRCAMDANP